MPYVVPLAQKRSSKNFFSFKKLLEIECSKIKVSKLNVSFFNLIRFQTGTRGIGLRPGGW